MLNRKGMYCISIKLNSNSFLIITCLLCNLFSLDDSFAQISQPNRIELPFIDNEKKDYNIFSAGEEGLYITRKVNFLNGQMLWELLKVNSDLELVWKKEYLLNASYNFLDHHFYDGKLYLLFSNFASADRNLELVIFYPDGRAGRSIVKNYIPFNFFDFKVTEKSLLISGYFNYRPLVINYNFENRIPQVLPGLFNDKAQIIEIKVNEDKSFDVVLSGRTFDKKYTLFINTYDSDGNLIKNITLDTKKPRSLLFGRSQPLENDAQIVAGVYGRQNSEYSRGVFLGNINSFGEQKIQFYNYAELKNFFNYLRAGRERRVKNRIERRKIKNKRIKFNYRFLVHKLMTVGDQYILLGEAFYPKYKTITGAQSGFFNPATTVNRGLLSTSTVFDGYRYTHAVVMGFDNKGNLLWDNSFEINDVISFDLEQFVHATIKGDQVGLLYVFDNHIRSKVIQGDEVIEGKELIDIKLQFREDEIDKKGTVIKGMHPWYDNVFYTYGTQKVTNNTPGGNQIEREVFFINKVVYN